MNLPNYVHFDRLLWKARQTLKKSNFPFVLSLDSIVSIFLMMLGQKQQKPEWAGAETFVECQKLSMALWLMIIFASFRMRLPMLRRTTVADGSGPTSCLSHWITRSGPEIIARKTKPKGNRRRRGTS